MDYNRCLAAPKTTIKRCRNYSQQWNKAAPCSIHNKKESIGPGNIVGNIEQGKRNETFIMQHYNGSIYTFGENINDIKSFTKPIFLWKIMNRQIANTSSNSDRKNLENQAKLIRCGSQNKIIEAFLKTGCFENKESVINFFQKKSKKFKKKNLEKARHFLGVIYYFKRKINFLKTVQLNIKIKLAYEKHTDTIIRIQKWFKYKRWLKKLPVKPLMMRKQFIPNTNKIITLQRYIRKYIKTKVKYSHNCPYSLEDYVNIPKKHRIVYKHKEGKNNHWRYYDILWMHNDFLTQTSSKRYVIEPVTKAEFSNEFVETVAKKAWFLTRKNGEYLNNERNLPYRIDEDWSDRFRRRSLYRFSLMMLDLCDELGLEIDNINNINNWRKPYFKLKYQMFYLEVMPTLRNIAMGINFNNLEDIIYYVTRDILRMDIVFTDTDMSDEIAGDAIYGILRIILMAKRFCSSYPDEDLNNYDMIKSVIKENFQERLMV